MDPFLGVLPCDGLVWRLRGETEKAVEGYVTPAGTGWLVRVVRNYESVLTETYPDAGTAVARAGQLRDGLVAKGWAQVPIAPLAS